MNSKGKKLPIKILLLAGFILALIAIIFGYRELHNKSCKNEAVEQGESIFLNGEEYSYGTPEGEYTVSNVLICKTDSGKKIYEIKEYENYEYIAVYSAWDGTIYERVEK